MPAVKVCLLLLIDISIDIIEQIPWKNPHINCAQLLSNGVSFLKNIPETRENIRSLCPLEKKKKSSMK